MYAFCTPFRVSLALDLDAVMNTIPIWPGPRPMPIIGVLSFFSLS